jgi:hypothetical protein
MVSVWSSIQELPRARLFSICIFICWADVTLVGLLVKENEPIGHSK